MFRVKLNHYQAGFLKSEARFCCLIAGVGTGKTLVLLLKAWIHCEDNPGALALIVRKEFVDLRDSTLQDFNRYFGVNVSSSAKEYTFPNGSKIMFRHGNENDMSVLKNINLSFIGIEQAEEYENDTVFHFLRDRLRRQEAKIRQFAVIANAGGQNWLWQLWINNAVTVNMLDESEGRVFYKGGQYECWTANSFSNAHNLPDDFIDDLRSMEKEAPNHYKQYVLNSFDVLDDDDILFTFEEILKAVNQAFLYNKDAYDNVIMGVDIARFGEDKCFASLLRQVGPQHFDEYYHESWGKKDEIYTVGRIMEIRGKHNPLITVVDADGLGGPYVDMLRDNGVKVIEYRGGMVNRLKFPESYNNHTTEDSFFIKKLISQNRIKISAELMPEMQIVRYTYKKGKKCLVSKEEMRTKNIKSPDHFDALKMACSEIDNIGREYVVSKRRSHPAYSKRSNPYKGMR